MKFILKILLTAISVPVLILFTLSINLKAQLLNPNFWQTSFQKNNVYTNLSEVVKNNLEDRVAANGGKKSDVKILTDLITTQNTKDFIDQNISNVLEFVNGKQGSLNFYIPVNIVPPALLPTSLTNLSNEISLEALFREFNVTGVSASQIEQIRYLGIGTTYLLFTTSLLILLIFLSLYELNGKGKRFTTAAIASVVPGIIISGIYLTVKSLGANIVGVLVQKTGLLEPIAGIVLKAILQQILDLWLIMGLIFVAVGMALFFVKKPSNKKSV